MDSYPFVVFRDGPLGRRAMLEGTRLDVAQVVETVRNASSVEEAAAYLSLSPGQVQACVRYYADHRREIDDYAKRVAAENESLRAAWNGERALLAP